MSEKNIKNKKDLFELIKALGALFLFMGSGLALLIMAGLALYTGKIKNRAGPDSYDYYSQEPTEFIVQVIIMIVLGSLIFFGPMIFILLGRKKEKNEGS